jgi:pimeloyl-ACP methyl ester carboxylesterase
LAPDLPGFGDSSGPFSIARSVTALSSVLDERGIGQAVLCGLSLSALVSLRFALSYPERVAGLVVVAGFAALPADARTQQLAMTDQLAEMPTEAASEVVEQIVASVPPPSRDPARRALAGFDPASLAALMREASLFDVVNECRGFNRPTIVAWGAEDVLNAPLRRGLASQLSGAATREIPGAGHVANLDAPLAFNDMLEEFLASLPAPGGVTALNGPTELPIWQLSEGWRVDRSHTGNTDRDSLAHGTSSFLTRSVRRRKGR